MLYNAYDALTVIAHRWDIFCDGDAMEHIHMHNRLSL